MHSFAPFFKLKISGKNRHHFFAIEYLNFRLYSFSASNFAFFLRIFDEILSGFRDNFQKRVTCVAFSLKFAKTNLKIAENSEICENVKSKDVVSRERESRAASSLRVLVHSGIIQ